MQPCCVGVTRDDCVVAPAHDSGGHSPMSAAVMSIIAGNNQHRPVLITAAMALSSYSYTNAVFVMTIGNDRSPNAILLASTRSSNDDWHR